MQTVTTISDTGRMHLRWSLIDGIGPILFGRILMQFGDADRAMGATAGQLAAIKGISREAAERIVRQRDSADVEREIVAAGEHGVRIICRQDEDYPKGLREIADPPIVLYVKGELRPTDAIAVAVVGSRRCTIYGSEQARRFGELLAGAGFTVVSGLARGIDSFAQHGAVDAGGRSIGVLGCGLDHVYPPENKALAEKVVGSGCLISELPMTTQVQKENFAPRNRILAGLSLGVLVVEAAKQSGALITARLANEYNREVFAVPGRVQDPMSYGTNGLIRDGAARLVMTLDDVLDGLGEVGQKIRAGAAANSDNRDAVRGDSTDAPGPAASPLSPIEKQVYDVIGTDAILQSAVMSMLPALPPGEVLATFTSLELKGLVRRLPGQLIARRGLA